MKYFTITELCRSNTAKRKGIDNTPNNIVRDNLCDLIDEVLDPVRERWGKPIRVNSGYRSLKLNSAIGGAKRSQHMVGEAADITTGDDVGNALLYDLIVEMADAKEIDFDQLIDEKDFSWLHISYRDGDNRGQKLKL